MNVTSVVPLKASVPGTVAPVEVSFSRMLVLLTVPAVTASLNVTVIGAVAETPLAPFAGVLDVTVGPSSSRVVHTDVNGAAIAFPERSFTPVVTVTVMLVRFGIGFVGMNSATRVATV